MRPTLRTGALALATLAAAGCEGDKKDTKATPPSLSSARAASTSTSTSTSTATAPPSATGAATAGAQAVRLVKHLELVALDALDGAYVNVTGPALYDVGDAANKAQGCADLAALEKRGYAPKTPQDSTPWMHAKVRCKALELVKNARPVKRTHLQDFEFDQGALAKLPASFAPEMAASAAKERDKQSAAGKTWAAYAPKDRITSAGDAKLEVENDANLSRLELLAFGDFDGDGTEDVLVRALQAAKEGTWFSLRLAVLTRTSPDGALREIAVPSTPTQGDCASACKQVLTCKLGPFKAAGECGTACASAEDDPVTLAAWSCRMRAADCEALKRCDK